MPSLAHAHCQEATPRSAGAAAKPRKDRRLTPPPAQPRAPQCAKPSDMLESLCGAGGCVSSFCYHIDAGDIEQVYTHGHPRTRLPVRAPATVGFEKCPALRRQEAQRGSEWPVLENRTCMRQWTHSSGLTFAGSGLVLQRLLRSEGSDTAWGGRTWVAPGSWADRGQPALCSCCSGLLPVNPGAAFT